MELEKSQVCGVPSTVHAAVSDWSAMYTSHSSVGQNSDTIKSTKDRRS